MKTDSHFNSRTGEVNKPYSKDDASNIVHIGCRKFAEAFTCLASDKDRLTMWKIHNEWFIKHSNQSYRWYIPVSSMPSRIKKRLERIGLDDRWDTDERIANNPKQYFTMNKIFKKKS